MKLWLLMRKDSVGYDEYDSFVVRAENEEEARRLARDSTSNGWTSEDQVDCHILLEEGIAEIILGSYNAG